MQKIPLLTVTDRFGVKRNVPLSKPETTIGRRLDNDVQIMSNSVSRCHSAIVLENGVYYLVDKGSKTGTFINDRRVERHPLSHLDRIRLGGADDYYLQFLVPDEAGRLISVAGPASDTQRLAPSAKEELRNLARYVEVNQAFKSSLAHEDVLRLIVDAAIELASAERGLIMLKDSEGKLAFKVARDHKRIDVPRKDFALSTTVVKEALRKKQTVVLNEGLGQEFDIGQSVGFLKLRKVICVPLPRFQMRDKTDSTSILQRDLIGVLYIHSSLATGALSLTSLGLLESLAFEASKCLENVRLMHEEQEKQKLERELELARDVQIALLPAGGIEGDHFELCAEGIPCRYVGGDFYNFMTLPDERVVLTLGDVSGKGISAALLASLAQGVIEAQFSAGHSPAKVVSNLNRVIVNRSEANRFITMFCAVLKSDGTLTWVNAGHNPPLIARNSGEIETLSTASLILGAFDSAEYHDSHAKLNPGDLVLVFSDGVTEAVNNAGELFGDERLSAFLRANVNLTAREVKDGLLEEVQSFTRGQPQGDDITVIALKMK